MKTHVAKRKGNCLSLNVEIGEVKRAKGASGATYLILRTKRGGLHVFVQTDTREVAADCHVEQRPTIRETRRAIWDEISS